MEYLNLRRTFGRTAFAASRLLGNLGVSGSTPLLERFGEPVGAAKGPSHQRVPTIVAKAKAPEVMIAQHDLPIRGGQWYRLSLRTRAGA